MEFGRLDELERNLRSLRLRTTAAMSRGKRTQTFNLSTWAQFINGVKRGDTARLETKCSAAGCAFGWATAIPSFRREGLKLRVFSVDNGQAHATPEYEGQDGFEAAKLFFDITEKTARLIFDQYYYRTEKGYRRPGVKPVEVAERIRLLIDSGEDLLLEMYNDNAFV